MISTTICSVAHQGQGWFISPSEEMELDGADSGTGTCQEMEKKSHHFSWVPSGNLLHA